MSRSLDGSMATMALDSEQPINEPTVTRWIQERAEAAPPLRFELIAGGRSNMTYTVIDAAGRKYVLRRPPMGPLLPSAHDMAREHRLMHALRDSPVPVPRVVGLCQDPAVNGRDFYVMHFVEGAVVRDIGIGRSFAPEIRNRVCHELIDTLCALHRVDIDAVGLGDFARRSGYIERQIKRWSGQWEKSKTREISLIDRVKDALVERMPEAADTTIAHGDYRLSNCIMNPDGSVAAVLDWELCTLGDPMADLAGMMSYWYRDGETNPKVDAETTTLEGFLSQEELAGLYAEEMGVSLDKVPYYQAFASWRLACIGEGVYARYLNGQQGNQDEAFDLDEYKQSVEDRVDLAAEYLGIKAY